jgi:hypothetical protein
MSLKKRRSSFEFSLRFPGLVPSCTTTLEMIGPCCSCAGSHLGGGPVLPRDSERVSCFKTIACSRTSNLVPLLSEWIKGAKSLTQNVLDSLIDAKDRRRCTQISDVARAKRISRAITLDTLKAWDFPRSFRGVIVRFCCNLIGFAQIGYLCVPYKGLLSVFS